jgi:hypothetical protein
VRSACAATIAVEEGEEAIEGTARVFEYYARLLWEECDDRLLREKGLVGFSGASAW